MKPKTLILMLVAVGCGLAASFMTSRYLSAQQGVVTDEDVSVLFPNKNLAAYARLNDPKAFDTKVMKKSQVTKDSIGDFETIKGRIVKHPVDAGHPLAQSDLLDLSQAQIDYKLEHGEIAMAVKVTPDTAGGGFILPGSRVDVLAFVSRGDTEGPQSRFILQNKEVLAINHEMDVPTGTVNKQVERVVLKLKHGEAEQVGVHAETGTIRLVLRRGDDQKNYDTEGAGVLSSKRKTFSDSAVTTSEAPVPSTTIQAPSIPERPNEAPKPAKGDHVLTIVEGGKQTPYVYPAKDAEKDKKKDDNKDKDGKESK